MKHGRVSSLLPNKSYYSFNSSDRHSWVLQELFPSLQPFFLSPQTLCRHINNQCRKFAITSTAYYRELIFWFISFSTDSQGTVTRYKQKAFSVHVLYIQCTYICGIYFIACIFSGNICCSINSRGKSFKGNIVWNKDRPKERGLKL